MLDDIFYLRSTVSNIISYPVTILSYPNFSLSTAVTRPPICSFQRQNSQQSIQFTDIFVSLFGTLQHLYLHPVKSYSTPFFLSSSESNIEEERLEC